MTPKPHGKKIKVNSLLAPDQYEQLKALADREQHSVSQMIAIIVYDKLRQKPLHVREKELREKKGQR